MFLNDNIITLSMPVIFFRNCSPKSRMLKISRLDFYITDLLDSKDDILRM